ncbi:GD10501 [Drosophila simulans]|uniref:GD10501 n=1 Tax=Drosophila simulans TaxID=7240 RepID=B4QEQ7_DROSI|nr:GD10501 [Drosophila simulans]
MCIFMDCLLSPLIVWPAIIGVGIYFLKLLVKPLLLVLFKTPRNGAQTTLYAALDPALKDVSGLYFSDCRPKEVSAAAQDDKTGKFLWAESEKWTGVNSTKVD